MNGRARFGDPAEGDIGRAILAIGDRSFPQALLGAFRRAAGVGHCMVFVFEGERSVRCRLDIGNIPIAAELGLAYSERFHLADPNRDALLQYGKTGRPIILPSFSRRKYDDRYRKVFFDNSAIVDKFATAVWDGDIGFYLNFYRTHSQGRFSLAQIEHLSRAAPIAVSAVANHFRAQPVEQEDPFRRLETAFATTEPLVRLTKREREVCLRILTGFTSEGISIDLGVSLQSTLTYRKRAYEKLGVTSQSELFGLAIKSLLSPSRLN